MMEIPDGGPAFANPGTYYVKDNKPVTINQSAPGMSLRYYFAGQALIGFQAFIRGGWAGVMEAEMAKNVASNCYAIADAMIAEGERRGVEHNSSPVPIDVRRLHD